MLPEAEVGSFICTSSPASSCHGCEEHPQSCCVPSQAGGAARCSAFRVTFPLLWPPCQPLRIPENTSSFLFSVPWVVFAILCSTESRRPPLRSVHGNYRNLLKAVPCGSQVQPLKSSSQTLGKKVACVSLRSQKK